MAVTMASRAFVEAEPEDVGMSSARLGRFSRAVQGWVDAGKIPGAITMVARHGKVVHFETYGRMDDEANRPMEPDALFRIYSMTKPIVSLALMMLYEEGKFLLDDPVSRHIPSWKGLKVYAGGTPEKFETRDPAREMTVRDLLMHTSGLPGLSPSPVGELYRRADIRSMRADSTIAEMAAKMAEMPLADDPGAHWIYGYSTDIVGYLCELLSGQRLDQFLQERIFQPLGMVDTFFYTPESKAHRLAANYRHEPGTPGYTLADAPATSEFARPKTFLSGVGGLLSTAADYMRFGKMLANGGELDGQRLVSSRTLKLMASNHLPNNRDIRSMSLLPGPSPAGTGFGLGFAVLLDPTVSQTVGSPGEFYWAGAACTEFFVSPADDLVAMFMTQVMMGQVHQFARYLRTLTYQALTD